MLLLRGKGPKSLYTILILAMLLFGRKKPAVEEQPTPKPREPFPIPDVLKKTVTTTDLGKARDRLRIASLERDIIGNALTTIYEAEAKGQLSEPERNQLTQRYKSDLKRVDGEIDTNKKVVDLHELESAKEDLLTSFHEKLMEIDLRINQIKPSISGLPAAEEIIFKPAPSASKAEPEPATAAQSAQKQEKPKEKPKNKAEERLEAIREEVLKAMERLEQIETEG